VNDPRELFRLAQSELIMPLMWHSSQAQHLSLRADESDAIAQMLRDLAQTARDFKLAGDEGNVDAHVACGQILRE
jgi:hypothetical protein